jgi:phospholipid transport system substrate-binding protein
MVFKRLIPSLFLLCLLAGSASAALANQPPMERIKAAASELIEILSDPAMQESDKHDATISRLRATAEKYIDFRQVTMLSVGRSWLKMSQQVQSDLTEAFIQLLERTYLRRIPVYEGQGVEYTKQLISGKKAKVFTAIVDKDKKIVVEFRLKIIQEEWMIYDVVAEGVSLVGNYRSQFAQVLNNGSPEELLKMIRERVEGLDKAEDDKDQVNS